ncbi:hypothetical protein PHET_01580 [Paragonimus heterotremus]|uniref:Uncharacterized protein n=1 Tax=Paragonimus heterotremus TaxID=100268 RepID=A0A8J4X318_9TREM|nr:hypothetical protein PHET_01580 [Paragonimus heterotremus]
MLRQLINVHSEKNDISWNELFAISKTATTFKLSNGVKHQNEGLRNYGFPGERRITIPSDNYTMDFSHLDLF